MINRIMSKYQHNSFDLSHQFLFIYAQLIALIHGVGFIHQGAQRFDSLFVHALTNTDAWHGGLPAISIFNISLISGIVTVVLTLLSMFLIIFNLHHRLHGLLIAAIFLSGGGFVYAFISIITMISMVIQKKYQHQRLTVVGLIFIGVLFIWLFASWTLGWIFPTLMTMFSFLLFIIFDIMMPLLIIWFHRKSKRPIQMKHPIL